MPVFRTKDVELIEDNVDEIVRRAEELKGRVVEPTLDKKWDIIRTVYEYVKEKRRKVYGGFALNALIKYVSPDEAFYSNDDIDSWDIDFYSPDPINDAIEIANRLHKKGYKYISARDAQHEETYKVFCETLDCADITYVPRQIYNRIPYDTVEGMTVAGTQFMMIDYCRIMTDFTSYEQRLAKSLPRFALMDKYYPLPHNTSPFNIEPAEDGLEVAFRTVHDFVTNRDSTIVIGMYAFNHLVHESKIQGRKLKGGRAGNKGNTMDKKRRANKKGDTFIKMVPVNYYEIISTDYKKDAKELIENIRNKFSDNGKLVTYVEHYPFFQFLGYSVNIMFEDDIVCKIYQYNHRCTPYHTVYAHYFGDRTYTKADKNKTISIGSFETLIMYSLINIMRARTINDNNTKNIYYKLISQMTETRSWYLNTNNMTIYDEGLFQSFVINCRGNVETPRMEHQKRFERLFKAKKWYSFKYDPSKDGDRDYSMFRFKNTSGNPINNEKNLQLKFGNDEDNLEDVSNAYDVEQDGGGPSNSSELDPVIDQMIDDALNS
jgi:hypothetical protein